VTIATGPIARAAARKVESFCVEPSERWMFAGDVAGFISVIDIDRFAVLREVHAHAGVVMALAAHPRLPYLAAMSTDRCISLWAYDGAGVLRPVAERSIRDIRPSNDPELVPPVQSTSQALAFHDSERRLVTRSGNAGVLELEFDDRGSLDVLRCTRLHGEYDLIMARYVKDGDQVLSGSRGGILVLSDEGRPAGEWKIGDQTIHWAEHVEGTTYLLASDSRFVARFDTSEKQPTIIGPTFTRDDLEYVTYNRAAHRAFVGSFDRNVYLVDPDTCVPVRIAFAAPFKCRWVKALERSPDTLLVQCRDGALYKVDVASGRPAAVLKATPPALWTAVTHPNGDLLLAGEGEHLSRIRVVDVDDSSRAPVLSADSLPLPLRPGAFTKRMDYSPLGALALGRSDGDLWIADGGGVRRLVNLGAAIRDLAFAGAAPRLFAACEDGRVHVVDTTRGDAQEVFRSPRDEPLPVWALAYNPTRRLLALAERYGRLVVISPEDGATVVQADAGRCKRMKWLDADTLLFNNTAELFRLELATGEAQRLVGYVGNTIEDFIWDARRRYLVLVCYQCTIVLCDCASGAILNVVPDQMDYTKGLAWVPSGGQGVYPLDFLTFGRSGAAHHFRIHDEKILALGPVSIPPP
jgi:WD40 repeat protein